MRCLLLILDGLGDHGHAAFGGQTPLQMASTPNLDRLAALGMTGLYHPWLLGTALPSEIAHFLLFGYDLADFPGRGYIEALGENLPLGDTDVALLGRIFAVKKQRGLFMLTDEDPRVDEATCLSLQQAIQTFQHEGVTVSFVPQGGIRGIVLAQGEVSAAITDSNPIYEGRPLMEVLPWEGHERRRESAKHRPGPEPLPQVVLPAVVSPSPQPEKETGGVGPFKCSGPAARRAEETGHPFCRQVGLQPLAIASGCLYRGLSRHLGMEVLAVKDTNDPEADLLQRLKLACQAQEA